jgi:hypothetical protein
MAKIITLNQPKLPPPLSYAAQRVIECSDASLIIAVTGKNVVCGASGDNTVLLELTAQALLKNPNLFQLFLDAIRVASISKIQDEPVADKTAIN